MSKAAEWKVETVKALEDMKHRPSPQAREQCAQLLACAEGTLALGQAERRVSELRFAIAKYDRNNARRTAK